MISKKSGHILDLPIKFESMLFSLCFYGLICCATSFETHQALFFPNTNLNGNVADFRYNHRSPILIRDHLKPSRSQQLQNQQPETNYQQLHYNPHDNDQSVGYTLNQQQQIIPDHSHERQLNSLERKNPFKVVFEWRQLDYTYPKIRQRQKAISSRNFIPELNLPLAVDLWQNRLFVTTPRWKTGAPSTLSTIRLPTADISPPLTPYPSWDWQADMESPYPDCTRLMSVYRIWIDECDRLWVADTGVTNTTVKINTLCPPKIVVFDLKTDELIFSYELPPDQVKEDALYSNIVVDVRNGKCSDAYAYLADVSRCNIVVFSLAKMRSWKTISHLYYPDPKASELTLNGIINYQWSAGVLGLSLAPLNQFQDRTLFFNPISSNEEFMVSTSVLRNETLWIQDPFGQTVGKAFVSVGNRGPRGQSTVAAIDRNSVQFHTLIDKNAIGCWNIEKPFSTIDVVAQDNTTLIFPIDIKMDQEVNQNVWVLSNKYPVYLYSQLNASDVNIRILRANVREAVAGTTCDPGRNVNSLNFPNFL